MYVKEITKNEFNSWLLEKHYAKKIPSVKHSYGLFNNEDIIGVLTYGPSPSCNLNSIGNYKQFELNRLITKDNPPKNSASFFIGQTFKLLPSPLSLISFSDISMSHHGYVYQATNWYYTGIGGVNYSFEDDEGNSLHNRSICEKIKKHPEYKHLSVKEIAEKLGYKKVLKGSKHRYFNFVGNKKDKRIWLKELKKIYKILPYPKGENKKYKVPKDKYKVKNLLSY